MSAPINDGGPAFPAPMFTRQADGQPMCPQEFGLGGMSLRDYFAAKALAGIVLSPLGQGGRAFYDSTARDAYSYADAMLAARERKGGAA